jgi:hypothetical protein
VIKQNRFAYITAAVLLFSFSAFTQNLATNIKVSAMNMGRAMTQNDFNSFIKYIHPKAIELGGGKENMKSKMDTAYKAMLQFGASFKRYSVGHPGEIVTNKKQLQALLPQALTVKSPWGEMTTETTLIAFSNDKGKTWVFFDTMVAKEEEIRKMLPDLSPKLKIPPRKKPKITPADGVKLPKEVN